MSGSYFTMMERRIDELLIGLASCLCSTLRAAASEGHSQEPCFCGVLPGAAVAQDYCDGGLCEDKGGMAWTRLVSVQARQEQGPGGESGTLAPNQCVTVYDVTVEIGVLRSAPMPDEEGEPPSVSEQLAASMLQNSDMGVMLSVIGCCDEVPDSLGDPVIGEYVPVGPEGGCVGGAWSATWSLL